MTYMLLTYLSEKAWADLGEAEQQRLMHACDPHVQQLRESGKFLAGAPLHPTTTATTIRSRDGQRLVTDGPFVETREQLGGYTLIDAKDLDEAIAIAWGFARNSSLVTIEIRPVNEMKDLPSH